jgi:transposase-like protein
MNNGELNLASLSKTFSDEDSAREFLEKKLWPNGPVCPHCGSRDGAYKLEPKPGTKTHARKGVYCCKACRKQYTVRVGTIFEDSHIPLCKWLMAFHLMMSSKKGISSLQMSREVGITPKSAWFLTHRIREAIRKPDGSDPLTGIIEADETYMGGKPRPGMAVPPSKRGWGTKKTPVLVLVQRDGSAVVRQLERVNSKSLKNTIEANVAKAAVIMTDQLGLYRGLNKTFAAHETVNHGIRQYVRKTKDGLIVHTNTAESFFALLKRGHYGIFHQMSKKHLHRYCNEFGFRWDHRHVTDGERMVAAIMGVKGKRLMYKQPGFATAG